MTQKISGVNLKYWLKLAAFTAIVIAVPMLAMVVYLIQTQIDILITPHSRPPSHTPQDVGLHFEDVTLTTGDGLELAAWHIPGSRPEAIILIHGINTNREVMLPTAAILAEVGYHVVLIDLRGHGNSEGDLISYGYNEALDVQAGADYLEALPEVEKIGVIGSSFGGAAVARAAAEDPRLEAVVIQRSYASLPDAVNDAFDDFTIFPRWPFAPLIVALAEQQVGINIGQVDSVRDLATLAPRPVLIIHSKNDQLFPVYHAHKMYNAAQEPKTLWLMESSGHGDPAVTHEEEYRQRIISFFEDAF